jgi:hypothetical protein
MLCKRWNKAKFFLICVSLVEGVVWDRQGQAKRETLRWGGVLLQTPLTTDLVTRPSLKVELSHHTKS